MDEIEIPTRWTDFDALGHVTHAAYPIYLDEARDAYLSARVGGFETWPSVIAHLAIDFESEIRRPAPHVTVRTRVTAVGRTSVTFEQHVVASDGTTAATAKAVVVAFDPPGRRSRELTPAERERLAS